MMILAAGVLYHGAFAELDTVDTMKDAMNTNFFSYLQMTKLAIPHLRATSGTILVISSLLAKTPGPNYSAYCASKFALEGFFNVVRLEEPEIDILSSQPPMLSGTNFRKNAVTSSQFQQDENDLLGAKEAAKLIVMAADRKIITYVFPTHTWLRLLAKRTTELLAPSLSRRITVDPSLGPPRHKL